MKRKTWKTAIASLMVLAMTVTVLPAQIMSGLVGKPAVVNADENNYVQVGTVDDSVDVGFLPVESDAMSSYSEQIYTKEETEKATNIVGISFHVCSTGDNVSCKIYLFDTDRDAFEYYFVTDGIPDGTKPCYDGEIPGSKTGWVYIPLLRPVYHDPQRNLMMVVVKDTEDTYSSPKFSAYNDNAARTCYDYSYTDYVHPGQTGDNNNVNQTKNIIRLYTSENLEWTTLTYDPNGGTGNPVVESVESGDTVIIKNQNFRYEDHIFTGWNTAANGTGTQYQEGESVVLESNLVLYAQWERVTFYDFEDSHQAEEWTFIDADGDAFGWAWSSYYYSYSGSGILYSASYNVNVGGLKPDNWAIAPAGIVDPNGTMTVSLWARAQDPSWPNEHFAIYAQEVDKVDLEHFNPGDWTKISDEFIVSGEYEMYTGDLSAFAGEKVYVAIRHFNCTDQFYLNIDDVLLPFYPKEKDPGVSLAGLSLSLAGDIGVNIFMELSADVRNSESAYMKIVVPNGDKTEVKQIPVSEAVPKTVGNKTYYVFNCGVSAKDIMSMISAQLIDGEQTGAEYVFSVRMYADAVLKNADQYADDQVDTVKALLIYGARAQEYFNVKTTDLADSGLTQSEREAINDVTAGMINKPYNSSKTVLPEGVTFVGATLSLKSETTLSLYFTSDNDAELEFTCEGKTVEIVKTSEYTIARIRGIKASELGGNFEVKINGDQGTVTYSPMTYCYNVLSGEYDEKLQNVCKALYMFQDAAKGLI